VLQAGAPKETPTPPVHDRQQAVAALLPFAPVLAQARLGFDAVERQHELSHFRIGVQVRELV